MIWSLRIGAGLALAWLFYLASPFVALHSVGRAVDDGDQALMRQRVNFRAVRVSLLKQIVGAYVDEVGGRGLSATDRQLVVQAGIQVAEPLVDSLLSPAVIIDLLDDGWPQTIAPPLTEAPGETRPEAETSGPVNPTEERNEALPAMRIGRLLRVRSIQSAWRIYALSELHGFRHVLISLPPDKPVAERFRLKLRLTGWTWKLTGIELPQGVLKRLLRRVPEAWSKRGPLENALAGKTH